MYTMCSESNCKNVMDLLNDIKSIYMENHFEQRLQAQNILLSINLSNVIYWD